MKLTTLTGIVLILTLSFRDSLQCEKVPNTLPCVCSVKEEVVDLRSLANNDSTAAFEIEGDDSYIYSYNPCNAFTDGDCKEVAGCQDGGDAKRSLGTQNNVTFETDNKGNTSIIYSGGKEGRSMIIDLICDEAGTTPEFEFIAETGENQYTFTLTTVCACLGGCDEKGPTGGRGSGSSEGTKSNGISVGIPGITILSIFFLAVIVYFVAGMIIRKVKYEKTGSDIIPNKAFWIGLPSLVKDGAVFTFAPCISYCKGKKEGYAKVY